MRSGQGRKSMTKKGRKQTWVKVWFISDFGWLAKIRRTLTNRPGDRVAIQLNDRVCMIDSKAGVMFMTLDNFDSRYPDRAVTMTRVLDTSALRKFLQQQLSKPETNLPQSVLYQGEVRNEWSSPALIASALSKAGSVIAWTESELTLTALWETLSFPGLCSTSPAS